MSSWRRWQKLLAAILTGARILTAEAMWNALAITQDYGNFQRNNWLYFGEGARAAVPENVL